MLRIDFAPRLLGIHTTELTMLVVVIGCVAYLAATRSRRGQPSAGAATGTAQPGSAAGLTRPFPTEREAR